jgi:hypothetical protein
MPPTPNNPQPGPQNSLPAPPTAPQPVYLTPPPANLPPLPVTIAGSQLPISPAPPASFLGNLGTPATGAGGPSQPPPLPPPGQLLTPPTIPNLVLPGVPVGQALQTAGGAVGGGLGSALEGAGTLLAGGPAGAIAAAVKAIYDQVTQALADAVNAIGDSLQKVASLDPRVFVDGLNAIVERVPLVGKALAAFNDQFAAFVESLKRTAERLAPFSGELAVATAQADVAQTLGDLRRAQQLGSGLARFTEAESRLSQTAQDILATILERLVPIATDVLEQLQGLLEFSKIAAAGIEGAIDGATTTNRGFLQGFLGGLTGVPSTLREIARNTRPHDDPPSTALILRDLLGLSLPDSPAPPRGAGFTGFNE